MVGNELDWRLSRKLEVARQLVDDLGERQGERLDLLLCKVQPAACLVEIAVGAIFNRPLKRYRIIAINRGGRDRFVTARSDETASSELRSLGGISVERCRGQDRFL
jgi:hypothetical protein